MNQRDIRTMLPESLSFLNSPLVSILQSFTLTIWPSFSKLSHQQGINAQRLTTDWICFGDDSVGKSQQTSSSDVNNRVTFKAT